VIVAMRRDAEVRLRFSIINYQPPIPMVSPERLESMRADWVKLLGRYGVAPADAQAPFDVLAAAYSAPERHYHNLDHLIEMFRVAGRLASIIDDVPAAAVARTPARGGTYDPAAVELAIWFHDAVYDPRAKDNEARSGELAVDLLGPIGVPRSTLEKVVRLVRATAHLSAADPPADRDTAVLLDADLAVLGASEDRYRRYAAAIR
jgi:predicted metal-dependent HD superfamily phosphohydrolase